MREEFLEFSLADGILRLLHGLQRTFKGDRLGGLFLLRLGIQRRNPADLVVAFLGGKDRQVEIHVTRRHARAKELHIGFDHRHDEQVVISIFQLEIVDRDFQHTLDGKLQLAVGLGHLDAKDQRFIRRRGRCFPAQDHREFEGRQIAHQPAKRAQIKVKDQCEVIDRSRLDHTGDVDAHIEVIELGNILAVFAVEKAFQLERQKRQQALVPIALLGLAEVKPQVAGREFQRQVLGFGLRRGRVGNEQIAHLDAQIGKGQLFETEHVEELKLLEFHRAPDRKAR